MTRPLMILTLSLGTIALAIGAARAQAGQNCAPRPIVLQKLNDVYEETRRSIGLSGSGQVVEVFAADSGSWTIIVTSPNGLTCVAAAGQSFETTTESRAPAGDPA
ncbi:hypothetical protein SAMN04488012_10459 [Palleronia salina]|uniref:Uncharacterized protein n=1 Tax=Palleronia salina TaxID=313368 RepID=A0A1M6FSM8_9RHOB|nr:hypothetical protein [Palleronia salina]SHJ00677.1 hypothetical protein SAMN04488012_10459 [Palleronia salina]